MVQDTPQTTRRYETCIVQSFNVASSRTCVSLCGYGYCYLTTDHPPPAVGPALLRLYVNDDAIDRSYFVVKVDIEEDQLGSANRKGHWHGTAVIDDEVISRHVPELLRDYSGLLDNFEKV
ncbi:hypothetical protein DXG01_010747, partial [Tephrocybe rancida]